MMMRHSSGTAMWEWWLMVGVVLLIIAAMTLGIVRLARRRPRPSGALDKNRDSHQLSPSGARQLLDQRYAAGDLGTDEYRERLVTLEQQG